MEKKKEERIRIISSAIQNPNHTKDAHDGALTFDLSRDLSDDYYPVGSSARFIYDIGNGYFVYFDESIHKIIGYHPNELAFADPVTLIMQLVVDEHLLIVSELTQDSFAQCKQYVNEDSLVVNLEYNIKSKTGEYKRVLSQFTPVYFEEDGHPKINKGRMTDITHIKKDGIPLLYIIVNNEIVYLRQGNPNQMIKSKSIIFSNKEIEVLRLISEGYSIKETASTLQCSIATIYTHRKNIKLKSQTDINKVITNLKEKGFI